MCLGIAGCRGCPAGESTQEDARSKGFTFWATGNEPGWTLRIGPKQTIFETDYGPFKHAFATTPPEKIADAMTTYHLSSDEHRLDIVLRKLACEDSTSGDQFETTVIAIFDGKPLPGCGQSLP
jgi:uncharacterized membrane protein